MIFYFSGTGNSLYAARSLDRECVSIPQVIDETELRFQMEKSVLSVPSTVMKCQKW